MPNNPSPLDELERLIKEHDAFSADDEWSEASAAAEGSLDKSLWQHRRWLIAAAREREELRADAAKFYDVMDDLKRTKMNHGACQRPLACTACGAQRRLDEALAAYKGRKVYLS